MKRYHEELPRTRRKHRLHLRWLHDWPHKPVDCPCDLQAGRFRKREPLACEKRRCFCKNWRLKPSTRDRRLLQEEAAARREFEEGASHRPTDDSAPEEEQFAGWNRDGT